MTNQDNASVILAQCTSLSRRLGYVGVLAGVAVLIGWLLDIPLLKSLLPGLVSMKANTALCFVLFGGALVLSQEDMSPPMRKRGRVLALLAGLIGFFTACEYFFGWSLGIDQALFKEQVGAVATRFPGRMGANTAIGFTLLGSALFLIDFQTRKGRRPAEYHALLVFLIALMALLGYWYGIQALAGSVGSYTAMALHTAVAFVLLALGTLLARPAVGMMATLTSNHIGALMGRRFFLLSVVMPSLFGWACLAGARAGLYDIAYSVALLVVLTIIGFTSLMWSGVKLLNQADAAQRASAAALRSSGEEITSGATMLVTASSGIFAAVSEVTTGVTAITVAVSQTSTTAEEIKQTAALSHQKAKHVEESAKETALVSEAGYRSVTAAIEGMHQIREQMGEIAETVVSLSEQGQAISEIIATVNDLAEQSNLLAVNAAIEASRAGEHGKGFTVLAQEVRNLARQSRQATLQVRNILMEVQKATSAAVKATEQGTEVVATGIKQATDAGDSILSLASNISLATQTAAQIASSSQQQLLGMEQIALAIANIRQSTHQNMTGTQQLAAAAKNLQAFSEQLKVLVERRRGEA